MGNLYKKHKRLSAIACVLAVTTVLLLGGTVYQTRQVKALSQQNENKYMSAFSDLCDYLDDIDVLIKKAMLSKDKKQTSVITTQIYMQTSMAKECLSQLPLSDVNLDKTSKFLVQTADYASVLAAMASGGEGLTEKEYENLSVLSSYAEKTSKDLENIREKIYNGKLNFSKTKEYISHAEEGEKTLNSSFSDVENEFAQYPALIYDGPFSEHIMSKESSFLKYQRQVTDKMALSEVQKILGAKRAEGLTLVDEGGGVPQTYVFKKESGDNNLVVAITTQGAKILWMIDNREVTEDKISIDDAKLFAKRFLEQAGFGDMTPSYYDKAGNIATLNFAYKQGDITVYTDLIKVKVALDNGEILGIESKGYLMNHSERKLDEDILSKEEAKNYVGKHLNISKSSLAIIPLESGKEMLCYEFKGEFSDKNFLIYINAKTGAEEKILMLLESAEGVLTI